MAAKHMIAAEGKIQIRKVISAIGRPPTLYPIPTRVCVEEGPGRSCVNEFNSNNSSSEI